MEESGHSQGQNSDNYNSKRRRNASSASISSYGSDTIDSDRESKRRSEQGKSSRRSCSAEFHEGTSRHRQKSKLFESSQGSTCRKESRRRSLSTESRDGNQLTRRRESRRRSRSIESREDLLRRAIRQRSRSTESYEGTSRSISKRRSRNRSTESRESTRRGESRRRSRTRSNESRDGTRRREKRRRSPTRSTEFRESTRRRESRLRCRSPSVTPHKEREGSSSLQFGGQSQDENTSHLTSRNVPTQERTNVENLGSQKKCK